MTDTATPGPVPENFDVEAAKKALLNIHDDCGHHYLYSAFVFDETKQGYEFWEPCRISPEAHTILEHWIAEAEGKEAGDGGATTLSPEQGDAGAAACRAARVGDTRPTWENLELRWKQFWTSEIRSFDRALRRRRPHVAPRLVKQGPAFETWLPTSKAPVGVWVLVAWRGSPEDTCAMIYEHAEWSGPDGHQAKTPPDFFMPLPSPPEGETK
jgi:hypothetical protein